ncbi:AMIN domain-containing protein [Ectothiorhodospiraceae bacterium BW-2]|nr:AMIN domain-containing protein [Ectothiorhodospiraceae bacterium BW-2]
MNCRLLCLWMILLCGWGVLQGQTLNDIRLWPSPDSTRLVFDLSAEVKHQVFTLSRPDRVVIDFFNVKSRIDFETVNRQQVAAISKIRGAVRHGTDFRIVLDLDHATDPASYLLQPHGEYGHRLVVELDKRSSVVKGESASIKRADHYQQGMRDVVVAIDAGHGGEDPGAISQDGKLREKDVVLSIARKLKALIDKESGMRGFLIRDGDYFIPLTKRPQIARKQKADLFISIHADAFADARAYGSSVYTLSQRGATSEHARLLAQKENASDLIGGVKLEDTDDMLASVLLDLTQTASIEFSNQVAQQVLKQIGSVNRLHKKRVEQANFRVLRSPDMPSLLVETAFISNPAEAQQLRSSEYQHRFAAAILNGVRSYFYENPPHGTRIAAKREHRISRGETLSEIAQLYRVSLKSLKEHNNIRTNVIREGQLLAIPES